MDDFSICHSVAISKKFNVLDMRNYQFVTTVNLHQHINSSVFFPLGSKSAEADTARGGGGGGGGGEIQY